MLKQKAIYPISRTCYQWLLFLVVGTHSVLFENRALAIQQGAAAQNSPEPALVLSVATEREIRSEQKHSYQLVLSAGQYAKVTIQQRGVDIKAQLFGPDGKSIADVDSDPAFDGAERIELVAESDAIFKLVIATSHTGGAGSYLIQLSEIHAASANENLLEDARRQFYESIRAKTVDESIALATKSLETRRKILGTDHADVAASSRALGNFYRSKNKLDESEKLLQQAADVTLKLSGETLVYSGILMDLSRTRVSMGDYTRAEQLNDQALAIRQKLAGPESLAVSEALHTRATMSRAVNNLPRAEENFRRVLAIREKLLAPDDPLMANVLHDFGLFYYGAGDYHSAEPLMQRALAIRERVLGPDHINVGATLNNLGLVEWRRGNDDKAESYYLRALRIIEKASPESDRLASGLVNLGIIYRARKNYAKAEEYYLRALAIELKTYGETSATAVTLSSLGILYREMSNFDLAEKYSLRALAVNEKMLGPNHQNTILAINAMARMYAAKGDIEHAIEYLKRVREVEERIIPLNQTLGSERQKLAYFNQLPKPDKVISFHVLNAPGNPLARDLAATMVLQRKGRVLDALADSFSSLRRRSTPEDQALFDQLGDINSQLSKLVLGGPQRTPIENYRNQVKALEEKREKLESEISRRSAGFYAGSQPVSLASVRSLVPSNAALIEFVVYRSFDWRVPDDKSADGEPRYAVYVLRNQGEVRWSDLGTAEDLDRAVSAWRQALRDPERKDVLRLARAVDEKVMQPVRALVGEATDLLISPDGELNLIPFAALVDEKGHYLVQRYSCSYLTSGRELLRMQVARPSESRPLVIANPAFGVPATQLASAAKPSVVHNRRRSVTAANDLTEVYFAPLRNTEQEAHSIQKLFPDANILAAGQATESAVKQVNAPLVLHIATHGFFLGEPTAKVSPAPEAIARAAKPAMTRSISQAAAPVPAAASATRGINLKANIENPLLRSGLALANANLRDPVNEDGILTALETSGLNLWGTKLVVLSACDTGVGEVRTGEGVYGLRRAFVLAGAESLVMTLWPVTDYTTRKLMTSYYKNLKLGLGRSDSLRQVQLEMLKANPKLHPFYWANFIQSGEWANLDGRR